MKKRIVISSLAIMVALTTLVGCGGSKYDSATTYKSEEAYESNGSYAYDDVAEEAWDEAYEEEFTSSSGDSAGEVGEDAAGSKKSDRKLIRTVNLTVETDNFSMLTAKIKNKTQDLGGYIESSSLSGSEEYHTRYASYTLRIPAAKADDFIAEVEGQGNVIESSENVEDVTLTYVDINSRKESLQVEYDRLEKLLMDADSIEELIYIEERLAQVRYEISSIESQLRTYDNKVDYTTIHLYVDEVVEYSEPEIVDPTYGERLAKDLKIAWTSVWEGLQGFSIFILCAIPYLLVIGVPIAIIFLIINKSIKKSAAKAKAKKEKAAEEAEEARRARAKKLEDEQAKTAEQPDNAEQTDGAEQSEETTTKEEATKTPETAANSNAGGAYSDRFNK